jgi:predicted amino acid racemase/arginase family enzyme
MAGPTVLVDLDKVEANARAVTGMCADYGIEVTAVTKVTCGMPQVARALLRGGAAGIGESRLENIHRLRANGIVADMMLLRIPPLSGTEEIVRSADVSLNSELSVIRSLSKAAANYGIVHNVIMMIDLGDLREGFWPDDVIPAAREIVELPNLKLKGVGTNLTCYGGVIPTSENMQKLVDWAHRIEDACGVGIDIISGGNSSSLPLVGSGKMPREVNHLRIGEGILLGRETIDRTPWPGTVQDAFRLEAEIIELKEKPSVPIGETGQDAFGNKPSFEDRGEILRAILNVGREDVDVDGLLPVTDSYSILGASSDHLLLDVSAGSPELQVGSTLEFTLTYSALLAAMTSSYVDKRTVAAGRSAEEHGPLAFFGGRLSETGDSPLLQTLRTIGYRVREEPLEYLDPAAFVDELARFISDGGFPVLCGAEPLSAIGFTAFSRAVESAGLIWLSPYASITSAYSGSDQLGRLLRRLTGEEPSPSGSTAEAAEAEESAEPELIPPGADNLVLIGLQQADDQEAELIHRLGIEVYTMEDVDQMGIQGVMRRALQRAVVGTRGLYVHYDQRLSDGGQEGLTNRETHLMMELLARTGFVRALDVSGTEPQGRRRGKLQKFVASAMGKRILG